MLHAYLRTPKNSILKGAASRGSFSHFETAPSFVCLSITPEDIARIHFVLHIVKAEDLDFLAESAYADACRPGNPRDTSVEEIKEGYGMKKVSPIGLEWYEQMDKLEDWCIGKTVEEVLATPLTEGGNPTDVDLVAGCTVHINDQLVSLQKAAASAR